MRATMQPNKLLLSRLRIAITSAVLAIGPLSRADAAGDDKATSVPDQVASAFRYGDFAELERLYAVYGQPGVRSPLTGTERVKHFWNGIETICKSDLRVTEGYYLQNDALTRKWASDHPDSVLAQLLYVDSLMSHAWFFRGTGFANTVSPESWTAFRRYLDLAFDQLQHSEPLAIKDSSWNRFALWAGRGLGWTIERSLAVFESGIAKNPDDDDLYFSMQQVMLPKWGGDVQTVERFIAFATQKTRRARGMEMYARLYAGLSYSEVEQSLFTSTRASWPTMKEGFEDWLSRYPKGDQRNMYAYFACMAGDRQTLQEQLALIGTGFESVFWGPSPERRFEECKTTAQRL